MLKPTKANDEAGWYSAEKLQQLLEYYVGGNDDHVIITHALSTEEELKQNLKQIQDNWQQLVIPLNVNALSGQLGEEANHWVGVHISYSDTDTGGEIIISYIDPMGRLSIDSGIRDILVSKLPGFTIRVEKPLHNKAIQHVTKISDLELQGNTDDCGPMLVYAMACLSRDLLDDLPTINNAAESKSLGSFLRESFNKKEDFNTIHQAAGNIDADQQSQSSVELDLAFVEVKVDSEVSQMPRGDYQKNSDVIVPALPKAEHQKYQISENKGNQQWILDAARTGKVERIQMLEKQGINLNEGTRDGYSILHYAVVNGMYELAGYLVQEDRINVNSKDQNGQTALHLAVKYDNLAIIQLLAAYINSSLVDENGNSPLHLAVLRTVDQTSDKKEENEQIVTLLADHNKVLVNCANYEGNTPLHLAVEICIKNYQASLGRQVNVEEDIYSLITQLLQLKADIRIENNDGYTPLHLVPVNNCDSITLIKELCQGEDVGKTINMPDRQGNTILHIASAKEMVNLVTGILIEKSISDVLLYNLQNNQGRTPIHEAAWNGNDAIFNLLVEKSNLYIKDYDNCSMIHFIAHGANSDILASFRGKLDIYLPDFTNFASLLDKNDNSVWHYLARGSSKSTLENQQATANFLSQNYPEDTLSLINAPNEEGYTPLYELLNHETLEPDQDSALSFQGSISTGYISSYTYLWGQYIEKLDNPIAFALLAKQGRNLNKIRELDSHFSQEISKSSGGNFLQHTAAQYDELEFFDYALSKSGSDINQCDENRQTVLHHASISGDITMVEKILKDKRLGHHIFTQDKNGITPVHLSVIHGHLELLKYFLENPDQNFWQDISFSFSKDNALLKTSSSGSNSPIFSRKIKPQKEDDNAYTYTFEGFKYKRNENSSLEKYIPRLNGFTDGQQNNLLHFAAEHNLPELMNYLLGKGMDISITNIYGLSPLHIASLHGNFEVCMFLLDKNLEYKNSIENDKQRERDVSRDESRYKAIEKQICNAGQNILHYAIKSGNLKLIKHYIQELGMDVNEGNQAFKHAILSENIPAIWYVINNASEFKFTGKDKLFFNVIDIGDLGLIDHFVSQQPDVLSFRDRYNKTPLERAIINHDTKLLPFLIERSFNVKDQDYFSPLDLLIHSLKDFSPGDYGKCVTILKQILAYPDNTQPNNLKNIFDILLNDTAELMQVMQVQDYANILKLVITKEVINFKKNGQETVMHSLMQQLDKLVALDQSFAYQILDHFLLQGADFTVKNADGKTAVEVIALEELVSTMDHLLGFYPKNKMEIPDCFAIFNLLKNADDEVLKDSQDFNNHKYGVLELYYAACHKNEKLFNTLIVDASSNLVAQIKSIIEGNDQFAGKQNIITIAQAADTFLNSGEIQQDIIVPSNSLVASWLGSPNDTCLLTEDLGLKNIFMQRCEVKKESEANFFSLVQNLSDENKSLLGNEVVNEMFTIGESPIEGNYD